MNGIRNTRKIWPAAGALIVAIGEALSDGKIDQTELFTIGGLFAVLIGTFLLPNQQAADDRQTVLELERRLDAAELAAEAVKHKSASE